MIRRRQPVKRGTTPIARSPLKRTRTRIAPMSEGRRAGIEDRRDVRMAVFARDGQRCQMSAFMMRAQVPVIAIHHGGPLTVHHLRKASAGGAYSMENLTTLCARCNGWVEDEPLKATALGLVLR